jgi:hypothetical protein
VGLGVIQVRVLIDALERSAAVSEIYFNRLCGGYVMRYIPASFAIGVLGVLLATPVIADHHTAQAIEHAAMAKAHGEDGHAKVLLKHAEESLGHAQAAEKQHAEQHKHMTDSIKELKQAIEHAKAGHADIATKHVDEALMHMRKSTSD